MKTNEQAWQTNEKGFLSALMAGGEKALTECPALTPSMFGDERNRLIFESVLRLSAEEVKAYGQETIYSDLCEHGKIEKAGGATYLTDMAAFNPIPPSAPWFGGKVLDRAREREMERKVHDLSTGGDPERLAREIAELCRHTDSRNGFPSMAEMIADTLELITQACEHPGQISGLSTGLTDLDDVLDGLQVGDMVTVAARPSVGKTALALVMAAHSARQGKSVGFFSLEMSWKALNFRLLSAAANVNSIYLRSGKLGPDQLQRVREKGAEIGSWPLYIRDNLKSITDIHAACRTLKQMHGLDLAVVDYMQLCRPPAGQYGTREQEVSAISREVKDIAQDLQVPVLALSQLSRESERREKGVPKLSDLRDSGSIEQDSDVVVLLHSPYRSQGTREQDGEDVTHLLELRVAKHRNGPTDEVKTFFDPPSGRISGWESHR